MKKIGTQKINTISFGGRKKLIIGNDEIQFYLAKGLKLHPVLYFHFTDKLLEMERANKVCLMPTTIFQIFHRKLKRAV